MPRLARRHEANPRIPATRALDPFELPAATTGRFLLLIVAVVGASLFAYDFLHLLFGVVRQAAASGRDAAWWMGGGVVTLLLVAGAIYLALPWWIVRRRRLSPLTSEDSPELAEELARLTGQAGLPRPPVLVVDALDPSVSALVFGLPRRRYLRLNGGLVTLFFTDIAAFRATVRHELAHLRNRDVDQTFLAVAIWRAFVIVALVPLMVAMLGQPWDVLIGMIWRALALTVLVRLFRNAVLRSREYGADARAWQWDGPDGALPRVLAASAKSGGIRRRMPFGTHPDIELRRAAIDDPKGLFRIGFWDAAGAGVAATIAFGNITTLINDVLEQPQPLTIRWIGALLFAPLAATGVTVGIWRAVRDAHGAGPRPTATVAVGAGLGCGMVVGGPLSLPAAITGVWGPGPAPAPLLAVTVVISLVAATVLFAGWIRTCALAWLPVVGSAQVRVLVLVAVLSSAVVLTVLLGYWTLLRDLHPIVSSLSEQAGSDYAAVSTEAWPGPFWLWAGVHHPLVLHLTYQDPVGVTIVLIWLFPIFGLLRWPSSDVPGPGLTAHPRVGRVGKIALVGLAGGAAYALLALLHRMLAHVSVAADERASPQLLMAFSHWQIVGALTAQAVVAFGVALWATSFRVVWGALAAFVTGAVALAGLLGGIVAGGCVDAFSMRPGPCAWDISPDLVALMARSVLVEGSLTAIAAALLGTAISVVASQVERKDPS
jgi:Zn-dependent protease with chaperone function